MNTIFFKTTFFPILFNSSLIILDGITLVHIKGSTTQWWCQSLLLFLMKKHEEIRERLIAAEYRCYFRLGIHRIQIKITFKKMKDYTLYKVLIRLVEL